MAFTRCVTRLVQCSIISESKRGIDPLWQGQARDRAASLLPGGAKPFLYSAGKARGELRAYSKLRRNLRAAREGLCGRHRQEAASPACIHGHFLPLSYRHLARRADVRFVTWLREPIDRLLSHYH